MTCAQRIVGRPDAARAQLLALHRSGAHRVALIPVGPDPFPALDSLARLLRSPAAGHAED